MTTTTTKTDFDYNYENIFYLSGNGSYSYDLSTRDDLVHEDEGWSWDSSKRDGVAVFIIVLMVVTTIVRVLARTGSESHSSHARSDVTLFFRAIKLDLTPRSAV